MQIRRFRGAIAVGIVLPGLVLGGVAVAQAGVWSSSLEPIQESEDVPAVTLPIAGQPGVESASAGLTPSEPELEPMSPVEPNTPDPKLTDPPAELKPTPSPADCSEPPSVRVDQSDPAFTTISISLSCQAETQFHRIVTASIGGVEVLKVDTRTDVAADASHATEIRIPKAQVCLTDGETGEETCLPS